MAERTSLKCQATGCENDAAGIMHIYIPAFGEPKVVAKSVDCKIGLVICRHHFGEVRPADFVNEQLKAAVTSMLLSERKHQCDFDRSFKGLEPIS